MKIFENKEVEYYFITILLLTLVFAFNDKSSVFSINYWIRNFFLILIAVGISFLLANYIHKLIAKRYYCSSIYELWTTRRIGFQPHQKAKIGKKEIAIPLGIILPLIITLLTNGLGYFPVIGTYKLIEDRIKRTGKIFIRMIGYERAIIYSAIPLTYLGLYFIFLLLTKVSGINFDLFININMWLALFSLLPLPNLIGAEILFGSLPTYFFLTVFVVISVLLAPISIILAILLALVLAFSVVIAYIKKIS